MTAPLVEVVVTADLSVKHSAMSPGKLEDTISLALSFSLSNTQTHTRAHTHSLNSKDGETGLNGNEIGK